MDESNRLVVEAEDRGLRLDQFLGKRHDQLSRRKARVAIEIGAVFVDRKRVKVASRKVRPGQTVDVNLGGAFERATKKTGRAARNRDRASLPSPIVRYQDDSIVVIDKPSGLLSAPTPESDLGNCVDWLETRGLGPVFVVHRIDLLTSGLLVFARTDQANRELSAAFRDHVLDREYEVAVFGQVDGLRTPGESLTVDVPVGDKPAVTHFELLARSAIRAASSLEIPLSLLEARLETGRQHQIRIHAQSLGLSVVRDPLYGDSDLERQLGRRSAPRLALHAKRLGLGALFPERAEELDFRSNWPSAMTRWLEEVGLMSDDGRGRVSGQGPPPSQTSTCPET